MNKIRPKKWLGQHFLKDELLALQIVEALTFHQDYKVVLEVGPGMGVLTKYLLANKRFKTVLIEIDEQAKIYLNQYYKLAEDQLIIGDILKLDLTKLGAPFALIGNFPFNISSQIFFKILDHKDIIPEVVCMVQKEVAERIASNHGNKKYGILSVLLQAFYSIEILIDVPAQVFHPQPKVSSAVLRLQRNQKLSLECDEKLFRRVIKQAFQNRRKTLRNALKALNLPQNFRGEKLFDLRPEQLSVDDFIDLTVKIEKWWKK